MHSFEQSSENPDIQEAASEALIESALPVTSQSEAIVAEVAEVAGETGLVEAARTADLISESFDADSVLRVVGQAALRSGSLDRAVRRDYVIMLRSSAEHHSYAAIRKRRAAVKLHTELEIASRRLTQGETPTK